MKESCHTHAQFPYKAVMEASTVSNESCHTHERVTSHTRMSHVAHIHL